MFWYKTTSKEILQARNTVFLRDILPILKEKNFVSAPFKDAWFGYHAGLGYMYDMCRLREGKFLELLTTTICRKDNYIQIRIMAFELTPRLKSLSLLKNIDGLAYKIRPNNKKEMRLDTDFFERAPILSKKFWQEPCKLGHYFTKSGYLKQVERLRRAVKAEIFQIDDYFTKWYLVHTPNLTQWNGKIIEKR